MGEALLRPARLSGALRMAEDTTARRKDAHLDLCATEEVEPAANSALFECVQLVHCAMPEHALSEVQLATPLFGKTLRAPLVITGMTGGTERAGAVNRDLASLAEKHGLAFGVGSQRAMLEDPSRSVSYLVRSVAPKTVVIGNIGLRQGLSIGADGARKLVDAIGADGLALHLNVGQELTQPEGDRDFRGGYALVEDLAKAFGDRFLVKETGCGLSSEVARRLVDCGVRVLDVSGLGGTSWVRVEQLRAQGLAAEVGALFSGWGIPTAAAVASVRRAVGEGVTVIASGGLRDGLQAAKAFALGADLAGMALPLFRAHQQGGLPAAEAALSGVITAIRHALLLSGALRPFELRKKPMVVSGLLKDWLSAL
jgi:isopentenyl-diphosphate delta-isomerase